MALVSDIQLQPSAVKPPNLDTSQKFSAEGLTATTAFAVTDAGAGNTVGTCGLITARSSNDVRSWLQSTKADGNVELYMTNDARPDWALRVSGTADNAFIIANSYGSNCTAQFPAFSIGGAGAVGIGKTGATNALDIAYKNSTTGGIQITETQNNVGVKVIAESAAGFVGTSSNHKLGFRVNNSTVGLFNTSGQFGIGTDSPGATLDVRGGAVFNEAGAAVDFRIEGDTDPHLFFVDGSADAIGMKTANPISTSTLHVMGTDADSGSCHSSDAMVIVENCGTTFLELATGNANHAGLTFSDAAAATRGAVLYDHGTGLGGAADTMMFQTAGSIRASIDASGRVGIGTDEPVAACNVQVDILSAGATTALQLRTGNSSAASAALRGEGYRNDGDSEQVLQIVGRNAKNTVDLGIFEVAAEAKHCTGALEFKTFDGSDMCTKMKITSAGCVGVGTAAPNAMLQVDGSAIFNDNGGDNDFRVEGDTEQNLFFIDASTDRVGIGTSVPAYRLESLCSSQSTSYPLALRNPDNSTCLSGVGILGGLGRTADSTIQYYAMMTLVKEQAWTGTGSTIKGSLLFSTPCNETGNERMRITSAGNVGIGTATPASKFHIIGTDGDPSATHSGDAMLIVENNGNTFIEIATSNTTYGGVNFSDAAAATRGAVLYDHGTGLGGLADTLMFQAGGSIGMVLDSGGEVGIGTLQPSAMLHVVGGSDAAIRLQGSDTGNPALNFYQGTTCRATIKYLDSNDNLAIDSAGTIQLQTASVSRAHVTAGFIGIGTASNSGFGGSCQQVIINGAANARLEFGIGGSQLGGLFSTADYIALYTSGNDYLSFQTCGTERVRILADGKVGIGTSAPTSPLHIQGTDSNNVMEIDNSAGCQVYQSFITSAGLSVNIRDKDGFQHAQISSYEDTFIGRFCNVGVGTGTPSAKLDVEDRTNDNGIILIEAFHDRGASNVCNSDLTFLKFMQRTNNSAGTVQSRVGQVLENSVHTSRASGLTFYTESVGTITEKMRISATGKVGIGTATPSTLLDVFGGVAQVKHTGGGCITLVRNDSSGGSGETLGLIDFVSTDASTGSCGPMARIVGAYDSTGDSAMLQFFTGASTGSGSPTITERLRITCDGKVGIGTTAPNATLQVDGSAIFNDGGGNNDFRIEGDSVQNLFIVDASTDSVGIGTSTPASELEISSGDGRVTLTLDERTAFADNEVRAMISFEGILDTDARGQYAFINAISTAGTYGAGELAFGIRKTSGGSIAETLRLADSGFVGIATTAPCCTAHVYGELMVGKGQGANANALIALNSVSTAGCGSILQGTTNNGIDWQVGHYKAILGSGSETALKLQGFNGVSIGACCTGSSSSENMYFNSNGRIGIGTRDRGNVFFENGHSAMLLVEGTTPGNSSIGLLRNNTQYGPTLIIARSCGSSIGSNVLVAANQTIGGINFQANDGTDFIQAAGIVAKVGNHAADSCMSGELQFYTVDGTNGSMQERMRIAEDGKVGISTTVPSTFSSSNAVLAVGNTSVANTELVLASASSGGSVGQISFTCSNNTTNQARIYYNQALSHMGFEVNQGYSFGIGSNTAVVDIDANGFIRQVNCSSTAYFLQFDAKVSASDNNTVFFMKADDCVATRMYNYSDGDFANHDGVYGTISDCQYKQDITDVRDYWDDFKALRYRKFRHKTDVAANPNAPYRLGLVAQEVESVFPALVPESEDSNPNSSVCTHKWVKSSVIEGPIMASVLQKVLIRLEAAEAKILSLEAAA